VQIHEVLQTGGIEVLALLVSQRQFAVNLIIFSSQNGVGAQHGDLVQHGTHLSFTLFLLALHFISTHNSHALGIHKIRNVDGEQQLTAVYCGHLLNYEGLELWNVEAREQGVKVQVGCRAFLDERAVACKDAVVGNHVIELVRVEVVALQDHLFDGHDGGYDIGLAHAESAEV